MSATANHAFTQKCRPTPVKGESSKVETIKRKKKTDKDLKAIDTKRADRIYYVSEAKTEKKKLIEIRIGTDFFSSCLGKFPPSALVCGRGGRLFFSFRLSARERFIFLDRESHYGSERGQKQNVSSRINWRLGKRKWVYEE